jgi:hypothetical protein
MTKNSTTPQKSDSDKEWRLNNARHLAGLKLQHRNYARWSENWDHDHCAACFAKFAEFDGPDVQHAGYATRDDYKHGAGYEWVCSRCFSDLKPVLNWTADEAAPK